MDLFEADYAGNYHRDRMTVAERNEDIRLHQQIKAVARSTKYVGKIAHGPQVLRDVYDEWRSLRLTVANRILRGNLECILNRCPKCGSLCRSPRAKQCRSCHFDWHEELVAKG